MHSISETIKENKIKGLNEKEVLEKIKKDGYNELPKNKKKSFLSIVFEILKEPMFLLLIICCTIYLFLGDIKESIMLLFSISIVIGITIYQHNKTERALELLKELSSPKALVIREGIEKKILSKELVTEDIIILNEGDKIPADAILLYANNLYVNESLLTGESNSVRKISTNQNLEKIESPGGNDLPFVYSGTLIVKGQGIAKVKKIGLNTEIGKIGKSLTEIKDKDSNLKKEISKIVKVTAVFAIVTCIFVSIIYAQIIQSWLQGILTGLTLAISILPEEFPVVLTVFLAIGAWRMSHKKVLARKQQAIQTLGSITVLCVDKTGTITKNKMTLKQIYTNTITTITSKIKFSQKDSELLKYSILASGKEQFDPMEKALTEAYNYTPKNLQLLQEYPLSNSLLTTCYVWSDKNSNIIAVKGAPESILDLCHIKDKKNILKKVEEMSNNGLRILAVAKSITKKEEIKKKQHDYNFEFLGLIGFEDPVRPQIKESVKECYNAGIRIIMITGDFPGTAQSIAKQIGLKNPELFLTGEDIKKLSLKELRNKIQEINIFARIRPEQKLILVNALKANNEIIAMTGDGVNDAPAIKSSDVGIAMGERGTDVARETSSMVILDDNFNSIVHGIKIGRRIFDNIRKAIAYLFAVHIPIVGLTILSLIFKWPLIFFPMHILFLELIIDPACSIVFEAEKEEKNVMSRPPRETKEKIFNKKTLIISIIQGLIVLIFIALLYFFALKLTNEYTARAMAFTALIFSNLLLILTNKSWKETIFKSINNKNNALKYVIIGALTFLAVSLFVPTIRELFKFESLSIIQILIALSVAILSILWFEIYKKLTSFKQISN